ncbi:MAG: OmpP1/FadL family transporter [Gammaproteobacteria bacterium]
MSVAAALAAATAGNAHAAGFALIEHGAAGLGNAFAGGAAEAGDLSTIWFNPAGMTRFDGGHVQLAAHGIELEFKFEDRGSLALPGNTGGRSDDGGIGALIPANYALYAINDRLRVGLGLNVPFGLKTKYDPGWIGRYQAIKSEIMTINVNPAVSFDVIPDRLSIGAGVSAMYINAELTQAVNLTALAGTALPDGFLRFKANDWSFGYNVGAMFQFNPDARIGVHYRAEVRQKLEGNSRVTGVPPAPALAPVSAALNGAISVDVDLPASLSLSGFWRFHEQWALMADATWTEWSSIPRLKIDFDSGAPSRVEELNWDDTWRVSVGLNYYYNPKWTWRFGVAFDESPVPNAEFRTARLPDNDRLWVSLGVGYAWSDNLQLDAGWAHLFIDDTRINRDTLATSGSLLVGNYDSSADVVGVQARYRFQ